MTRLREIREHIDGKRPWTARASMRAEEQRDGSGELVLRGEAAVFDIDSEPIFGMFVEQIRRGAFRKVLATKPDVRFMENHTGPSFGRTGAGTLTLRETPTGLEFEVTLNPEDQDACNLYARVKRGDMDQCSFAFCVAADEWVYADDDTGGLDRRFITEIGELFEVSVVTFPAYTATSAEVSRNAMPSAQETGGGSEQQPTVSGAESDRSTQQRVSDQASHAYEARRRQLLTLGVEHDDQPRDPRRTEGEASARA